MSILKQNKDEIIWNIINSLIAGALVFFGSVAGAGFKFSLEGLGIAVATALIIAFSKFKEYWATQEGEYRASKNLFCFVGGC